MAFVVDVGLKNFIWMIKDLGFPSKYAILVLTEGYEVRTDLIKNFGLPKEDIATGLSKARNAVRIGKF